MLLAWCPTGLIHLGFLASASPAWQPPPGWRPSAPPFGSEPQLQAYFSGHRQHFDLPLQATGTPFQRAVWEALEGVPYGRTVSYAELATRLGKPRAVRAVGAALGKNPLPIFVPCHRVVGSDGRLTGFAGGLAVKQALLELETRHV